MRNLGLLIHRSSSLLPETMRVVRQGLVLALASLALLCTPASSFAVHAGKMVRAQAGHVRPPGRVVMAAPMQQALLAGAFFDTPFTAWLLPLGGLLPSSPARRTIVSIATLAVLAVFKLGSSILPTRNGAKPDAPTALPDAEAKVGKVVPLRISPLKQKTSAAPVEELTLEPFVALGAAFAGVAADSAAAVASATFTLISGDEEASST